MAYEKDYTGRTFNSLTCIKRIRDKVKKETYYICECECGNITKVGSWCVSSGHTKTCGKCPINTYDFSGEHGVGCTQNGEEFYFDKCDYEKIRKYNWGKDSDTYIVTTIKGKQIYMHRYLMSPSHNEEVDHINRIKYDNRRENLRLATRSQNSINKGLKSTNKSGITGVYYDKSRNKWATQITKDGKVYSLGRFDNLEDAKNARIKKEIELFGEFSPHYQ